MSGVGARGETVAFVHDHLPSAFSLLAARCLPSTSKVSLAREVLLNIVLPFISRFELTKYYACSNPMNYATQKTTYLPKHGLSRSPAAGATYRHLLDPKPSLFILRSGKRMLPYSSRKSSILPSDARSSDRELLNCTDTRQHVCPGFFAVVILNFPTQVDKYCTARLRRDVIKLSILAAVGNMAMSISLAF